MATENEVRNYLLAKIVSFMSQRSAEEELQDAYEFYRKDHKAKKVDDKQIDEGEVDKIYDKYPTKDYSCNRDGMYRTIQKGEKARVKLRQLILKYGAEKVENEVDKYIDMCKREKRYMRDFTTFLNNMTITDDNTEPAIQKGIWQ